MGAHVGGSTQGWLKQDCCTSAGDALLVDLAEVSHAAVVGAGSNALTVHRVPTEQGCLRNGKLLHDTCKDREGRGQRSGVGGV